MRPRAMAPPYARGSLRRRIVTCDEAARDGAAIRARKPTYGSGPVQPDRALMEEAIGHLAAIETPSASPGEREAAEWIAARLEELGAPARVEEERAHGTYWWPLGILNAVGLAEAELGPGPRRLLPAG